MCPATQSSHSTHSPIQGLTLGSLKLETPLCLSPLAGYTNLPFRLTIKALGGLGLVTTDLINARSLLEGNRKALQLAQLDPREQPVSIQIFGSDPGEMREAAVRAQELGAAAVDINMGCPVRKVCRVGGGSAMMTELAATVRLVEGMVRAVRIPVTAKMRLGWDENNITAPDLALALEDAGIAAVFVHGRTRAQGFSGVVNTEGIRAVVKAVKHIPVIGNGDITTPKAAWIMRERTGCSGVSIGRGAFYNPWIFRQILEYWHTGQTPPEPDFEERIIVLRQHFDRMVAFFGEETGCKLFRKVGAWYAKRFGPSSFFKQGLAQVTSREEMEELLHGYIDWRRQFLDTDGSLLPRYRPPAQISSLEDGFVPHQNESIPVPKGPVEVW